MAEIDVVTLTRDDMIWPFRGQPYFQLQVLRRRIEVDGTPGYGHDPALVKTTLREVATRCPIPYPVTVYVLPVEDVSRTNGCTLVDIDYQQPADADGKHRAVAAQIVLSGKRIPPHPAMTRYLVAHEYGHVVEEWINTGLRGNPINGAETEREYAALRGLEMRPDGGNAGRWHATPCEVLANDFRVLVCGIEADYWPHPGVAWPKYELGVREWWRQRLAALGVGVELFGDRVDD